MLTEYIQKAMRQAHYELMESGRFFGSIPPCRGAWGEGSTLEECREQLQGALECWVLVGLRHGDQLPVIDGMDLTKQEYEPQVLEGLQGPITSLIQEDLDAVRDLVKRRASQ